MPAKRLAPTAIVALKDALSVMYWFKENLHSFLSQCLEDTSLLDEWDWTMSKRQNVATIVDRLSGNQAHLADLTRLCTEVSRFSDYSHFQTIKDGHQKAHQGKTAVTRFRKLMEPHDIKIREEEESKQRRTKMKREMSKSRAFEEGLIRIKERFNTIAVGGNHQQRGFELERFMFEMFKLFDLDPRPSFRIEGEQIDGAFILDHTDYLFEARWQQAPVPRKDLDVFTAKVQRKLENTLGLFLSINGFYDSAVSGLSSANPRILLMDGEDLMAVLEQRIDFVALMARKKRHASQTGNVFLRVNAII